MDDNQELHNLLVKENKNIDNMIQQAYLNLLEYYNKNKDTMAEYQAKELSKIIHLIEVSENYNDAFKHMHYLEMETNNLTCKYSYVDKA